VSSSVRSPAAPQQWELRPRSLAELLDLAFVLYRAGFRIYLSMIAFSLLGLGAFGLDYLNLRTLHFETWLGIFTLGMTPPAGSRLRAAFGREFFFADGAIFWTLAAALLAHTTARTYLFGEIRPQHQVGSMMRWDIWALAALVGLPIILLRLAGVSYLADLLRFPALCAPHLMALEHCSLGVALRRGWAMVRGDLPRALAVFVASLALVRLAATMPFVGLLLLGRILPELAPAPGLYLLPIALLAELLVYPAAQIAVTLLYYDLRIRREGLDIALTAVRRAEEVANNV
jgi:hypothetical protein